MLRPRISPSAWQLVSLAGAVVIVLTLAVPVLMERLVWPIVICGFVAALLVGRARRAERVSRLTQELHVLAETARRSRPEDREPRA